MGGFPGVMVVGVFGLLHPRVREALGVLGYREPTPVQERAIPVILRGVDVVVVAPTGSGKTEAALLPVFSMILSRWGAGGLRAIYVTPLRSLNRDIFVRMERLAGLCGLRLAVRHGDTVASERRRLLEEPPEVMVTTPETLYFLLSVERFREALAGVRHVIVDELHELLDDKRGCELVLALERLEVYAGHRVQRIGLSATIRDPRAAAEFLSPGRLVEVVEAGGERGLEVVVETPSPTERDEELARMLGVESPHTAARVRAIAEMVERARGGVLVFTNTRDTAEVLGALLRRLLGDRVLVHHGSLSREERVRAEKLFREGVIGAVVATSSLELGIDIGHVELVVQYMSPRQAVKLLQRVGRSRHRLGLTARGVVVALDNIYDILESAVLAARAMRGDLEPLQPYRKPLDALAHQLAGAVAERGEVSLEEFLWLARRTKPYEDLEPEELEMVAQLLASAGILRLDGGRAQRGRRLYSYYYQTTMIPDTRQYPVYEVATRQRIGVLDEAFVATLEPGDRFVLAGRVWEVVSVGEDRVVVKPSRLETLIPPAWEGELIPVDWRVAREVGSILRRYATQGPRVLDEYPLAPSAREKVEKILGEHLSRGLPLPSDRLVLVEAIRDTVVYHVFLGSRGCKALELALSMVFRQVYGYTPKTASTPYTIVVKAASRVTAGEAKRLLELLAGMGESEVEELVRQAARRTRLFQWKLYHVAQRMGLIEKGAKPDQRLLRVLADTAAGEEALRELLHDKVDMEALARLLVGIRRGIVRVHAVDLEEPSPLALQALAEARLPDRIREETLPPSILVEVVRRRLQSRRVRLVCLMCGNVWEAVVASLPERVRCERCGAGFVAPTRLEPKEARRLVEKMRRRQRLTGEEARHARELREAADLVLTYGRRAVEALVATGVGPATARKVLSRLYYGGEEEFYKAILEAEQRYLRTRRYWRT